MLISSTARQEFQDYLRQALDTYHPRWELGIKGKELKHSRQMFTTVAYETLRDWVSSVKGQCPQQKSFQSFLDEAEFPEETSNAIWTLYLAFKRERKQGNQLDLPLTTLKQFTTQQKTLTFPGRTTDVDDHVTMPLITSTPQKEYMHEQNEHPIREWAAKINEQGADRLAGVTGVDSLIFARVESLIDRELEQLAKNPTLQNISSDTLADAVLQGLYSVIDALPKANIAKALDEHRKNIGK